MKRNFFVFIMAILSGFYSCKRANDTPCPQKPTIPIINGPNSVAIGNTITLSANISGGTWGSGNSALATVSSDGVVTGVAAGVVMIRYYVSNRCSAVSGGLEVDVTGTVTYTIGENFGGGVIAYVLQPGDPGYNASVKHGLIALPEDYGDIPLVWYNGSTQVTSAVGTAIGTGSTNSTAIVAIQSGGAYAAAACGDFTRAGYADWYLPSKDELNKLYENRVAIGGFGVGRYWSSSEIDATHAWSQLFSSGSSESENKDKQCSVRPVRSF